MTLVSTQKISIHFFSNRPNIPITGSEFHIIFIRVTCKNNLFWKKGFGPSDLVACLFDVFIVNRRGIRSCCSIFFPLNNDQYPSWFNAGDNVFQKGDSLLIFIKIVKDIHHQDDVHFPLWQSWIAFFTEFCYNITNFFVFTVRRQTVSDFWAEFLSYSFRFS
jgi:hypothetical protein